MITHLDERVTKLLKSQVVISSLTGALREALQNSMDAHATHISASVDFKHHSFTIIDNGEGITPKDLDSIARRYFTSKLRSFDQLKGVTTWGFRGEALNSIAAVSNLTIISKCNGHNGVFMVKLNQGKRVSESTLIDQDHQYFNEIKGSSGTVMVVKGLFLNVPVRLEHLSKVSETKLLEELRAVVLQCLVANPTITIDLFRKVGSLNQMICKYKPDSHSHNKAMIHAISSLYGITIKDHNNCMEITYKDYNVKCIISLIPVQSRSYQFMYWNKRVLRNPELFNTINRIFQHADFGADSREILVPSMSKHDLSPKKGKAAVKLATTVGNPYSKHPVFIVNVTGPVSVSDLIQNPDKSVHVSKHWSIVGPLIVKVIKSFLKMNGYKVWSCGVKVNDLEEDHETLDSPNRRLDFNGDKINTKASANLLLNSKLKMGKILKRELNGMISTKASLTGSPVKRNSNSMVQHLVKRRRLISEKELKHCSHATVDERFDLQETHQNDKITLDVIKNCKVIKQVDTKFILLKSNGMLYIIDQHACDERIKVEALLKQVVETAKDPFKDLSLPLKENSFILQLSNMDYELFQTYQLQFNTWGIVYSLSPESQTIQVTHLPELLHPKLDFNYTFIQRSLTQYAHDHHNHSKVMALHSSDSWWIGTQSMPTVLMDLINSKACRSAIMFGTKLTREQCEILIDELKDCVRPYWCAHGRPSIVPVCDLSKMKELE